METEKPKVAFLSSYPPRHCGIGEFTADIVRAVGTSLGRYLIFPIDNDNSAYLPPIEPIHIVNQTDSSSYGGAAGLIIQESVIAKVKRRKKWIGSAEHDYGLDGNGRDNNYNLFGRTLNEAGVPSVIRVHAVIDPNLHHLEDFRRDIMKEFGKNYNKIIVLTPSAKKVLISDPYNIDPNKIVIIRHGVAEVGEHVSKDSRKKRFGLEDRMILATPGMVSKGKGLEFSILGFSAYLKTLDESERKKTNYIIYGATHPEILKENNWEDPYREKIYKIAEDEGLKPLEIRDEEINPKRKLDLDNQKVILVNTYIRRNVLEEFIPAIDIGLTTYKNPTQCASGVGAKLAGYGVPCVSTSFMFHNDLFRDETGRKDNSGYLVKFKNQFPFWADDACVDPDEVAKGIIHVKKHYDEMHSKILGKGIQMTWRVVGAENICLFNSLLASQN